MELETLLVDRADGVVTVTLNRPQRKNAISGQMWTDLLVAFREIGRNPDDRVLVLTGAGGDFCSGADLTGEEAQAVNGLGGMRRVTDVAATLHRLPQPTIAKVRGVAVGAGMNMALLCDLVVAADTARFAEIFARRALSIDFGGSWILPRLVGLQRAKELALLADIISAAEAERLGLVNRVVADAEIDDFVAGWAARLAAGPPVALAQTKRLLDHGVDVSLEQALEDEAVAQTVNMGTADVAEAMRAFVAKRTPIFEGR